jgi:hypothetical protein
MGEATLFPTSEPESREECSRVAALREIAVRAAWAGARAAPIRYTSLPPGCHVAAA